MSQKSQSNSESSESFQSFPRNQIEQKQQIEIELNEQVKQQTETEIKAEIEHVGGQVIQSKQVVLDEIVTNNSHEIMKELIDIVQHMDQAEDFSLEIKEKVQVVKKKRKTTQDNMQSGQYPTEYQFGLNIPLLSEQPQRRPKKEKQTKPSLYVYQQEEFNTPGMQEEFYTPRMKSGKKSGKQKETNRKIQRFRSSRFQKQYLEKSSKIAGKVFKIFVYF